VRTGTGGPQALWAAAVLLFLPPAAFAAKPPPPRRPPPKASVASTGPDVFVGYSYLRSGEANMNGWELTGSFPFRGSLRLLADLSGHYGSFAGADLSQLTFLAGLRLAWHEGRRLRPFGDVLVGGSRIKSTFDVLSSSTTAWGGALGLGADYGLSGRWAVRGQATLHLLHSGGWDADPKLSAGVVYRFGR
jgi:opacity protein-like surface antigen